MIATMLRKLNANVVRDYDVFSLSDPPYPDFTDAFIDVTIPADSTTFQVSTFFTINDDNLDEDEQSFAIVAEILAISENISCFQTAPGTIPCYGRRGATEIRIADNDCKFLNHCVHN